MQALCDKLCRRCARATIARVLHILLVTFPFFALDCCRLCGGAQRRMLPLEAIPGLNAFVLYFALPCMLFRFGAGTPIAQLLDAGVRAGLGHCARCCVVGATVGLHAATRASAGTTRPSARWWRPSPTPASWACRC